MQPKMMRTLARAPRFIPGLCNHCDCWCARGPLSQRCPTYALEQERDEGDPASRNVADGKFWRTLHENCRKNIEMVGAARGIDLDAPKLQGEVIAPGRVAPALHGGAPRFILPP
jgi:hypothetical protein